MYLTFKILFWLVMRRWIKIIDKLVGIEPHLDFVRHLEELLVIDDIDPYKFVQNLKYLDDPYNEANMWAGTPSVHVIDRIFPIFNRIFIAAYPDVYCWIIDQNTPASEVAFTQIELMSQEELDFILEDQQETCALYRIFIDTYKLDGNDLECADLSATHRKG
jgi:hypothetical protein